MARKRARQSFLIRCVIVVGNYKCSRGCSSQEVSLYSAGLEVKAVSSSSSLPDKKKEFLNLEFLVEQLLRKKVITD